MTDQQLKEKIKGSLAGFADKALLKSAADLFGGLGYHSERSTELTPNNGDTFVAAFATGKAFSAEKALLEEWKTVDFLFQLTGEDIGASTQGRLDFGSLKTVDNVVMESYLFFAIALENAEYTRTQLSTVTREINRLFPMPVMVLFKHGSTLTLSIIDRRLNKKESAKDVLEKVTLIKDINFAQPHRAHIEILFDLSLESLKEKHGFSNFVQLHEAWRKTLNIQALNKRFFVEIRNWFYWARLHTRFPDGAKKDDGGDSEALIRLLTRMIFCWFLREKKLVPEDIFADRTVESLLKDWRAADCETDKDGRFYKAILQNLFFATLATPAAERKFRTARSYLGKNKHYGDQRYFRHVGLFNEKAPVEDLYRTIPFLNGGLFENLDEIPGRDPDVEKESRVDGFSDVPAKQPIVPDCLFFGVDRSVPELGPMLGESGAPHARGLLRIFRDYKFTIEENTPLEEDLALDPELLGRTFENLLAAVNPETGAVARKSTGSFYTPREIVHYMVEEALFRHLFANIGSDNPRPGLEGDLRDMVSEEMESNKLNAVETAKAVTAISRMRILDLACGSGAFPMGLLQMLVHVLRKLDPRNQQWKAAKLAALPDEMRKKAEQVFKEESFDYTRKLELIKDCIHGVDIQPAAIQISKLRFFLSLVIEQNDANIRPLPNLETKFICANSLLGIARPRDLAMFNQQIEPKEEALLNVRARHFFAQSKEEKDASKAEDRRLRRELSDFILVLGGSAAKDLASAVAAWDPYRGDRRADYFDPESMFGIRDGFDITIGNPPYVRADEQSEWNQSQRRSILASDQYETLWEKWDLFVPFIERSYKLLRHGGVSTMIVSDAFCHSKYAQKPQEWFLKNASILRLDFCSDLQIFDAAVHNLIYFFQRVEGAHNRPERRVHREIFGNVTTLPSEEQAMLTQRVFFPDRQGSSFSVATIPLTSICYISYGIAASSDEKLYKGEFVTDDVVQNHQDVTHPKRYIEGKHIQKWVTPFHQFLEWGTERAPRKFRRQTFIELHETREKLMTVVVTGGAPPVMFDDIQRFTTHTSCIFIPWDGLARVRNNSLKKAARYRGEKPLRPDLPKREELEATSRRFSIKYLLGVMNSSAARDFLRANRRSNIHLYPDDWKKLPIPVVTATQQQPVIELVDQILVLKRADLSANVSALEKQLDQIVFKLYGLTSNESDVTKLQGA